MRATVEPAIDSMTAAVELTVDGVAATVELPVNAIALAVEPACRDVVSRCVGPVACTVQSVVDNVAASVHDAIDPVPFPVEPLFYAVAAAVQSLVTRCVLGVGRAADEQARGRVAGEQVDAGGDAVHQAARYQKGDIEAATVVGDDQWGRGRQRPEAAQ